MAQGRTHTLRPPRGARLARLAEVRQGVLALVLPASLERAVLAHIDGQADRIRGRGFMQLHYDEMLKVMEWLPVHCRRPGLAHSLLYQAFAHLDRRSQAILATRAELAAGCKASPAHVSTVIGELERLKILWREPIPGSRSYRLILNARVGTKLPELEADEAFANAPLMGPPGEREPAAPAAPPRLRLVPDTAAAG